MLGGARFPGSLGRGMIGGASAGRSVGAVTTTVLAWRGLGKKALEKATREVGRKAVLLGLRRAGARIAGKLLTGSAEWKKVFIHIAEHFSAAPLAQKGSHGVFKLALRSQTALEPLIKQAATKPSRKILTRATVQGVSAGRPVVILEREFAEDIGEHLSQQAIGGPIRSVPCRILRVIVDITGKPVTAYPVPSFFAP